MKKRKFIIYTLYFSRKTVVSSVSTSQSQYDYINEMTQFAIPFVDSRLSKWYVKKENKFRYSMRFLFLKGMMTMVKFQFVVDLQQYLLIMVLKVQQKYPLLHPLLFFLNKDFVVIHK